MGWFERFKSKNKTGETCLVCSTAIRGDNYSIVKYQYVAEDGTRQLSDAHLCASCTTNIENQAREQDDAESL